MSLHPTSRGGVLVLTFPPHPSISCAFSGNNPSEKSRELEAAQSLNVRELAQGLLIPPKILILNFQEST